MNFSMLRWLVRRVDAGKILELTSAGLLIKTFWIALFSFFQGRIDEHLEKFTGLPQFSRQSPLRTERRDERNEHNQTCIDHQPRHFGDPSNVFDAIGVREAEILV